MGVRGKQHRQVFFSEGTRKACLFADGNKLKKGYVDDIRKAGIIGKISLCRQKMGSFAQM